MEFTKGHVMDLSDTHKIVDLVLLCHLPCFTDNIKKLHELVSFKCLTNC